MSIIIQTLLDISTRRCKTQSSTAQTENGGVMDHKTAQITQMNIVTSYNKPSF